MRCTGSGGEPYPMHKYAGGDVCVRCGTEISESGRYARGCRRRLERQVSDVLEAMAAEPPQTRTYVASDIVHLCPGEACAVCRFVRERLSRQARRAGA